MFETVDFPPQGGTANALNLFLRWLSVSLTRLAYSILTANFDVIGAAMTWSLRLIADALVFVWLLQKLVGVPLKIFGGRGYIFGAAALIAMLPIFIPGFLNNYSPWLLALAPLSAAGVENRAIRDASGLRIKFKKRPRRKQ